MPLNIVEDTIKEIPVYLSDDKKAKLFGMIIAITYYKLKKYDKALENCDKALDLNPNFLEALYNKGKILDELGNYKEAVQYYDESIGVDPKYIVAWNNRGLAYAKLGDYNSAIQSYDTSIKIRADYPFAWYNRGLAFYELGRYSEAIKSYDETIKIRPQYYDAWYNRGLAYTKLGDYNSAIQSYDNAIEVQNYLESPIDAVPFYNRACSKVKIGRFKEGMSDLIQAIRIGGPKYRELAKLEKDFDNIRNEKIFKDIIIQ